MDPALQAIYDRISQKAGGKRAIVGIARRLIGRIRSCFRTGTLYSIGTSSPNLSETRGVNAPASLFIGEWALGRVVN
jgi:hypothetical protein